MSRTKIGIVVAVIAVVVVLAVFLAFAVGNPQWHPRIYAYQAKNAADNLLAPPASFSGVWQNWSQDGKLLSWYTYKNGRRDGPYAILNDNGEPTSQGQYLDGGLDGIQVITHADGVKAEIPYVKGVRHGIEKSWYPSGQIAIEAPWENGAQEGIVLFYHDSGGRQAALPFHNGKLEGQQFTWHENGQLLSEEHYRNGMRNGRSAFWGPDGKEEMVLTYRNDVMDGPQLWFHPNGNRAKEFILRNEMPHGHYWEWDEEGKVIRDELYEDGVLKDHSHEETEGSDDNTKYVSP